MTVNYLQRLNQYQTIPFIVDEIIKQIDPEKIILFGSCAKKCINKYSDIDLCIIMKEEVTLKDRIKIRGLLIERFLEITEHEVDLLIVGEAEWERKYKDKSNMLGKVYIEGEVLYGRQQEI